MTSVVAGLSSIEASRRLAVDGPNQLPAPRRPSALRHFGKQFTHPLAILLWVASGLALLAGQPALAVAMLSVDESMISGESVADTRLESSIAGTFVVQRRRSAVRERIVVASPISRSLTGLRDHRGRHPRSTSRFVCVGPEGR